MMNKFLIIGNGGIFSLNITNMTKQENITHNDEKKIKLSTLVYAILVILVVVIGIGSILAYGTNTVIGGKIAAKMSKIIPFPAVFINYTSLISVNNVQKKVASIEKFYATEDLSTEGLRIDFTTPDGQKRLKIKEREILNKMVEDKIIEILAKKQGLSISKTEIDNAVSTQLAKYGTTKDLQNDLLNSYGWTLEDFKAQVVMPIVYKTMLTQYAAGQNMGETASKTKIQQAQKELVTGKDFAEVAKNFSDGSSKENGGELGWVTKDQVVSELQSVLFGEKQPEKNSIIESSIGFHIVEIENRKKENNEDVLQLRQIFVAKNVFADWLETQKRKMKVWIPLKEFAWDISTGSVIFQDEQMNEFEKNQRSKAQGDASIMF